MSNIELTGRGMFSTVSRGLNFRTRKHASAALTRRQKASLAEYVANGGSCAAWARQAGLSQSRASQLWRGIVADLGWQAR